MNYHQNIFLLKRGVRVTCSTFTLHRWFMLDSVKLKMGISLHMYTFKYTHSYLHTKKIGVNDSMYANPKQIILEDCCFGRNELKEGILNLNTLVKNYKMQFWSDVYVLFCIIRQFFFSFHLRVIVYIRRSTRKGVCVYEFVVSGHRKVGKF